jgi:hypothetical protein
VGAGLGKKFTLIAVRFPAMKCYESAASGHALGHDA